MGSQPAASFFNLTLPDDVQAAVDADRQTVDAKAVNAAWKASPWAHLELLAMDTRFDTTSTTAWEKLIPHLGTDRLQYLAPDWVCREFAGLFQVVCAGVAGLDACARVLDFGGHHSYNAVVAADVNESNASMELTVLVVEPQTGRLVAAPDPKHHYTGRGLAVFG